MDLNINELPERESPRRDAEIVEMPVAPPRQSAGTTIKIVAFLAVVVTLTALAIGSHHTEPGVSTAASEAPPAAAATTMPAASAPTDRTTTGAAPRVPSPPPADSGNR